MKKRKYRKRRVLEMVCVVCHDNMTSTRRDRMTCSDKCRALASRVLRCPRKRNYWRDDMLKRRLKAHKGIL